MLQVKSKVWLEKNENLVFGSGKALILRAIAETGSINKSAKKLNMSYRHAWSYVRSAEQKMNRQLLIRVKGGFDGGGAYLTEYAKDLLIKFEALESKITEFVDCCYEEIFVNDNKKLIEGNRGEDGTCKNN